VAREDKREPERRRRGFVDKKEGGRAEWKRWNEGEGGQKIKQSLLLMVSILQ